MNIETRKKGDVVIVDFEGRLAVGVGDDLLPRLIEQLLGEGNRKILLNLSQMDYIDSNGLGELVQSLKVSGRAGASLRPRHLVLAAPATGGARFAARGCLRRRFPHLDQRKLGFRCICVLSIFGNGNGNGYRPFTPLQRSGNLTGWKTHHKNGS